MQVTENKDLTAHVDTFPLRKTLPSKNSSLSEERALLFPRLLSTLYLVLRLCPRSVLHPFLLVLQHHLPSPAGGKVYRHSLLCPLLPLHQPHPLLLLASWYVFFEPKFSCSSSQFLATQHSRFQWTVLHNCSTSFLQALPVLTSNGSWEKAKQTAARGKRRSGTELVFVLTVSRSGPCKNVQAANKAFVLYVNTSRRCKGMYSIASLLHVSPAFPLLERIGLPSL